MNSTSINVTWRKLSANESNGQIFGYRVCYRVLKVNAGGICTNMRDIYGVNNTHMILTGLMKVTTYDVAIRANSIVGYGPVGNIVSYTTLDGGRCFRIQLCPHSYKQTICKIGSPGINCDVTYHFIEVDHLYHWISFVIKYLELTLPP